MSAFPQPNRKCPTPRCVLHASAQEQRQAHNARNPADANRSGEIMLVREMQPLRTLPHARDTRATTQRSFPLCRAYRRPHPNARPQKTEQGHSTPERLAPWPKMGDCHQTSMMRESEEAQDPYEWV